MTHPFHPLFGHEYELMEYRQTWVEDRVYYVDEAGQGRSLPAQWTSLLAEDPAVVVAAGRAHFRVSDLLQLVQLVHGSTRSNPSGGDPAGHGAGAECV